MQRIIFETPRLLVRHVSVEDLDEMLSVYGDADAMRWVGDGLPLNRAQCAHWIEVTFGNYASRGYGMNALVERQTGTVIGFCGLVHPHGQLEAEVKYALKREYWGKGLATEAVRALLDYAQQKLGLKSVIATIAPENIASYKVLLKVGMRAIELRANEDGTFTKVLAWYVDGDRNSSEAIRL
jgi:RimJ/RimL family protein N-acetyltransferase